MKRRIDLSMTFYQALVVVLILFKSSKVSVQAVESFREIYLTATNGTFSSPGYPMIYPKSILWIWIIPSTQQGVILKIKEIDLYRCYVFDKDQVCSLYDHVNISGHGSYCNWYKPKKKIVIAPWVETKITFKSYDRRDECRGSGFKARYRKVTWKTTIVAPTTMPVVPTYFTSIPNEGREKIPLYITLPVVFGIASVIILSIILMIWCCRNKSRNWHSPPPDGEESHQRGLRDRQLRTHSLTRQTRDESIRYSHVLRNDDYEEAASDSGLTRDRGPPPSYDEVCNNDRIIDSSHKLGSPPSYQSAMSQNTRQTDPESLNQITQSADDIRRNHDNQGNPRTLNLEPSDCNENNPRERSEVFV